MEIENWADFQMIYISSSSNDSSGLFFFFLSLSLSHSFSLFHPSISNDEHRNEDVDDDDIEGKDDEEETTSLADLSESLEKMNLLVLDTFREW